MSLLYESAARQPDQEPACEIGDEEMPPGHRSHHWHVRANYTVCSCERLFGGAWSVVILPGPPEPPRCCSICGAADVLAEQDWPFAT